MPRSTPNNGRWAAHPSQHLKRPKGREPKCRQACPSQQEALPPARSACIGGNGTEPYVQNTQQSPGSGLASLRSLGNHRRSHRHPLAYAPSHDAHNAGRSKLIEAAALPFGL